MLLKVKPEFVRIKTNPSYEEDKDGLNLYVKRGSDIAMIVACVDEKPPRFMHGGLHRLHINTYYINDLTAREKDELCTNYKYTNLVCPLNGVALSSNSTLRIRGNYYTIEQVYSIYNILKTILFKGLTHVENTNNMLKVIGVDIFVSGFNIEYKDSYDCATFKFKDINSMKEWYSLCNRMFEFEEKCVDIPQAKGEYLDKLINIRYGVTRRNYGNNYNSNLAPNDHCYWNYEDERWEENNLHFRNRINKRNNYV